jgi:hypothetical protein
MSALGLPRWDDVVVDCCCLHLPIPPSAVGIGGLLGELIMRVESIWAV